MAQAAVENFVLFPSTHWSEVFSAGQPAQEEGRKALENLLVRYQPALKAHLIGRFCLTEDQAMDLLQEFVLAKVLEKNLVGQADQARGRFRTFLLTSLDNFVVGQLRHQSAQKRSPGEAMLSLLKSPRCCTTRRSWRPCYGVSGRSRSLTTMPYSKVATGCWHSRGWMTPSSPCSQLHARRFLPCRRHPRTTRCNRPARAGVILLVCRDG